MGEGAYSGTVNDGELYTFPRFAGAVCKLQEVGTVLE